MFTDISIVEILESESNREDARDRSNQVDIKVKDSSGQIILIEVQHSPEQDYLFRILFSSAKCITEHYIINIKNVDDIAKELLDEWIYFLKNEEIKDDFHAKGLNEAKEKLDLMKLTPAEKNRYSDHLEELRRQRSIYKSTYVVGKEEGRIAGHEEGREEGREVGREEGR